jgi:ATP-dependent helicase/nuclease subunit A
VTADRVLAIDFKTGSFAPADASAIPVSHVRQMAAYAAALAVIFPGRIIEAGLLYTSGPSLLLIEPERLARLKPGFEADKEDLIRQP